MSDVLLSAAIQASRAPLYRSYDNEIRVLRHMARLCKEQLARYPTTLEVRLLSRALGA